MLLLVISNTETLLGRLPFCRPPSSSQRRYLKFHSYGKQRLLPQLWNNWEHHCEFVERRYTHGA